MGEGVQCGAVTRGVFWKKKYKPTTGSEKKQGRRVIPGVDTYSLSVRQLSESMVLSFPAIIFHFYRPPYLDRYWNDGLVTYSSQRHHGSRSRPNCASILLESATSALVWKSYKYSQLSRVPDIDWSNWIRRYGLTERRDGANWPADQLWRFIFISSRR